MRDELRRARLVTRPDRWLADRARRVPGPRPYRLRGSGLAVAIEHRTNDVSALEEVIAGNEYEPPSALAGLVPRRILDLGAHVGLAALWCFARWPGCRVTSVEADPRHLASLRAARDRNPGLEWEVVPAVAAVAPGRVPFRAGLQMGSHVGEGGQRVRAVDVLPLLAEADLVKCDVEGSEWEILADPRLAGPGPTAIVVEAHASGGVSDPVSEAAELLARAGFALAGVRVKPSGPALVWAVRR